MILPLISNPPLSMLALYRRVAIWERKTVISTALTAVWLTNIAFLIYGAHLFAADMRQRFDLWFAR